MSKKKKNQSDEKDNLVFTTGEQGNSFFDSIHISGKVEEENLETQDDEKSNMVVRVMKDRKRRAGKDVSLVTGLDLYDEELKVLAKEIKTLCGTGGTAKDGEIIIQGDFVDKIVEFLRKKGFKNTKRSGG